MSGKNQRLFADEPVEVQDFKKFTDHFRGIYFRTYLKCLTACNRLDLESLEPGPTLYAQKLPSRAMVTTTQ